MSDEAMIEDGALESVPMALWKKALAVLSLMLGGVGVAFGGATGGTPSSASAAQPRAGALVSDGSASALVQPASFDASSSNFDGTIIIGDGAEPEAEESTLWAPLLAKGGLSFFVAFCIGYALRTFLKGTMLVFGVVALAIFGLQKAGIVGEINWERAQGYWDDLTAGVGRQFESLKTFVTGSLPSAATGSAGLIAGFRR